MSNGFRYDTFARPMFRTAGLPILSSSVASQKASRSALGSVTNADPA